MPNMRLTTKTLWIEPIPCFEHKRQHTEKPEKRVAAAHDGNLQNRPVTICRQQPNSFGCAQGAHKWLLHPK